MEIRTAKINISMAGGTATKGSKTCKITLPTSWIDAMALSEKNREVELTFDGNKIMLTPRLNTEDFTNKKRSMKHDIRMLRFYDKEQLCTVITADFTDRTLAFENYTTDIIKTAFGNNAHPSWEDFEDFLKERCIPKERDGLREYLDALGIDAYDPIAIIKSTGGRMAEDNQWIEIKEL